MAGGWEALADARPNGGDAETVTPAGALVVVSCYTRHDELAHQPRGRQATFSLYTYQLDAADGSLTLLNVTKCDDNLAFTRFHPELNIFYSCTESLKENGKVVTFELDRHDGKITRLGHQDAGGTSTCYLTLAMDRRFLLLVNYWSSSVTTLPVNPDTGTLGALCASYHPKGEAARQTVHVQAGKHSKHSNNDAATQRERQLDPHTHAIVLDPFYGCIAYVPDLGMDVIHELYFDRQSGSLTKIGDIPVGVAGKCHGPRYIEFHPRLPVCYVINEISSIVAVFRVEKEAIAQIERSGGAVEPAPYHSLSPLQSISTIPAAFDPALNTCGRITVHPSGRFVVVSNRGHNSLTVFRIKEKSIGRLELLGWTHTRGETPRHFQFTGTGDWLIVANQDSDSLVTFSFSPSSGRLKHSGLVMCPSPNFVACCPHTD